MFKGRDLKFLKLLLLLLVAAIGAAYLYVYYQNKPAPEIAAPQVKAEDFPEYFVLDRDAKKLSSKTDSSSEGPRIRNIYLSQVSVEELAKRYGAGMIAPEWQKSFEKITPDKSALFSLRKRFSRLGVSISKNEDGTLLVLDYYPRLNFLDEN